MKLYFPLLTCIFVGLLSGFLPRYGLAQVSIHPTGNPPDASAILDLTSTSRGVLLPRMSTSERDMITMPATGLLIYNVTTNKFNMFQGATWIEIASGNLKELVDADGDTKIQVEQNADEDKVRFIIAGNERMRLENKYLSTSFPGNNVAIGNNAGVADDGTNNNNTFIGFESGTANTSGSGNVFIGHQTGKAITISSNNTLIGSGAGDVTTTNDNTFIGFNAGGANTTGIANVFIGKNSGLNNTIATQNTFVGTATGQANSTGSSNTFVGHSAGQANTNGAENTFLGFAAGSVHTTGDGNVFIGVNSGGNTTTADNNTFVGTFSGTLNTTGTGNAFFGEHAGFANSTGSNNTFIGKGAGDVNTTNDNTFIGADAGGANTFGIANTFVGKGAGDVNISANNNTFIGYDAGGSNSVGANNTFVGQGAGDANVDADNNTFIGKDAGGANTGGFHNTFVGYGAGDATVGSGGNTFIGSDAGGSNVSGIGNVFIGRSAGGLSTNSNNTFVGNDAGGGNTGGQGNVYIGRSAAQNNSTGSFNTAIGQLTVMNDGFTNSSVIGSNAICNVSNKVRIGNTSVTVIEGQVDWTFPSDARFKYNVKDDGIPGLDFIRRLRPVTYQFDRKKFETHLLQNLPDSIKEERLSMMEENPGLEQIQTGFLAQEVEQVCQELHYTFSGLHVPENESDNYGIAYGSFVPLLVKAVQEQQEEINSLKLSMQLLLNELQEMKAAK